MLGIDAGERRVGVAMSDEYGCLLPPVTVLDRRRAAWRPFSRRWSRSCNVKGLREIVVGLPLNADGSEGRQARRARDFARVDRARRGHARRPVGRAPVDARSRGDRARAGPQRSSHAPAGELDAIAAAAILQDYLDDSD